MPRPNFVKRDPATDPTATICSDAQTAAAGAMTATLAAAAGVRNHLAGFAITGLGATGASSVEVITTGLAGTQLKFRLGIPAGATVAITPLVVPFDPPLPASADNTAITIAVPSFGSGNTSAAISAWGYRA